MSTFRVSVDIGHLIPANAPIGPDVFPNLVGALDRVAVAAQSLWRGYASGRPLPDGSVIQSRSGAYMRSIDLRQIGDFSREIYSDLAYADAIERGSPEYDMKRALDSSMKVRVSKDGKRYLVIPFRHGTPGTVGFGSVMTEGIHEIARAMAPSRVTAVGKRRSETGAFDVKTRRPFMVDSRTYYWGDRLNRADLAGASAKQAQRMKGMVRFDHKQGGHSQFMTFRVMHQDSTGWIRPAQAGKWPAKTVAEQIQPIAERAFAEAVRLDVEHWLAS